MGIKNKLGESAVDYRLLKKNGVTVENILATVEALMTSKYC